MSYILLYCWGIWKLFSIEHGSFKTGVCKCFISVEQIGVRITQLTSYAYLCTQTMHVALALKAHVKFWVAVKEIR